MNLHQGKLQNQYTRVNGLSMFARVFAQDLPEDAPVVILVHGLVLASRYMIPTAELLASKYRITHSSAGLFSGRFTSRHSHDTDSFVRPHRPQGEGF